MKISVSNYGPIAEAKDIELCPLTVFVGPSNTGKSYLAVLIYALFHSFEIRGFFPGLFYRRPRIRTNLTLNFNTESIDENIDDCLKEIFNRTESTKFSCLPEELQKWTNKEISKVVSDNFHKEILRCMGISQKGSDWPSKDFNLDMEDKQKTLTFKSFGEVPTMKIKNLDFAENSFRRLYRQMDRSSIPKEIKAEIFLGSILEGIFLSHNRAESFYLPAARTGIMQSHRAIAGALVQRATFAGIENFSIPALSGIVSDFLEEIILLDTSETSTSNVKKVADEMEKNILHGSIKSESSESNQYPQFLYKQNGFEVPLLRSSSMVSELAPVVLFIKHRLKEDDLLIIEEPEAHLHPEAQRNIAKTVVHLIRAGVRVMVTTHSDYFLEQLGNYVRSSKLTEEQREKLTNDKFSFLKENEIGAYVFNQHESGTTVERLHFDQENGLSPEDHNKVSSDLYNETAEILDEIENNQ